MIGIPPIKGVKPSTAVIAVRPLLINSSKKRVGFLKRTAVRALPIEIVAPIAKVPSRRSSAIKFPPSSTTAITPPGALFFFAYSTAAAIAFFAPSRLRDFFFHDLRVTDGGECQDRRDHCFS